MPKATTLTPDALSITVPPPQAATPPRMAPRATASAAAPVAPPSDKNTPLQLRLSRKDVKAIKVAAAEDEKTLSEFMLACFHEYMKNRKHA